MRRWSWRICRVAGIGIYVHGTFLILPAFVGLAYFLQGKSFLEAVGGMLFIGTLFFIVVLHELGHALTAKHFGIRTRDITLLPIGGIARLEKMPYKPWQELLVALAGPAVNVTLAVMLFVLLFFVMGVSYAGNVSLLQGDFLLRLMWINVFLAAFNMLPAFPMDGGRVLRALLAMRLNYVRATRIAAAIGQGMAVTFGLIGLFINPFLILIALFVWVGAAQEANMVQMKWALNGVSIDRVMITDFRTVSPEDTLENVTEHILAGFQHDFPVVENGQVVGVLTRSDLLKALAKRGQHLAVRDVMQQHFKTAAPDDMADIAFARLQRPNCRSLPVMSNGRLVGIVTLENVGEFLMIQEALGSSAQNKTTSAS